MPPTSMGAAKTANDRLLKQRATVYTADPTTGRYTTIIQRNLPCVLVHPAAAAPANSAGRAELLSDREIWWSADTPLPEQCRFFLYGTFWAVVAGTFAEVGDGETVIARRCAVIRQQ